MSGALPAMSLANAPAPKMIELQEEQQSTYSAHSRGDDRQAYFSMAYQATPAA